MMPPTPKTHSALTTNGVLHATESSSFGIGGGTLEIPFFDITKVEIMPQPNPKLPIVITTTASDIYPFVVDGIPSQVKEDGEFVGIDTAWLDERFIFKKLVDSKLRSRATETVDALEGLVALTKSTLASRNDESETLAQIRDELKRHN
eukprot:CAMPEP_0202482086 /NCGR_PEP_ID=MMETSP1361-20130828/1532_1 /ASSEMBLY_ACC=CAM_ASM_000849 /TAXON_ID=210615 /ORGANISM="Staurosira complex sp., Strain CCMP2646" /LENGTH=147 /DNA_ID=CAMNT_0049109815 /DNA_START=608 /DNA_END=1048 /DNA_ORIENTATION=-